MDPWQTFLSAESFAVAGASRDQQKYGNRILKALIKSGRRVYALNPNASEIEGLQAYASLADLPEVPQSLLIVTPGPITRKVVEQAIALGVKNVWMQPGAQEVQASLQARQAGLNLIDDGSCILVSLAIERPTSKSEN